MVDEYVLVDSHIIDEVSLDIYMDEYKARAWQIQEDRNIDKDKERIQFDIDDDDLLDNSESVFKVDARLSSHHKLPIDSVSQDDDVEKYEMSESTQHILA